MCKTVSDLCYLGSSTLCIKFQCHISVGYGVRLRNLVGGGELWFYGCGTLGRGG